MRSKSNIKNLGKPLIIARSNSFKKQQQILRQTLNYSKKLNSRRCSQGPYAPVGNGPRIDVLLHPSPLPSFKRRRYHQAAKFFSLDICWWEKPSIYGKWTTEVSFVGFLSWVENCYLFKEKCLREIDTKLALSITFVNCRNDILMRKFASTKLRRN